MWNILLYDMYARQSISRISEPDYIPFPQKKMRGTCSLTIEREGTLKFHSYMWIRLNSGERSKK